MSLPHSRLAAAVPGGASSAGRAQRDATLPTMLRVRLPPARRPMLAALLRAGLAALLLCGAPVAHAERADRDKPVNIEAERMTYDDLRQVNIFEGKVVLTQGTLTILAERIVVRQDPDGFQHGTAEKGPGGLAYFRQKREGVDETVQGWGDRIEYDARKEAADMIGRARFLRGADEVRGHTIRYDGRTEFYSVNSAAAGAAAASGAATLPGQFDGRVRATIQPRAAAGQGAAAGPGGSAIKGSDLLLKPSGGIAAPRPVYPEPAQK